MHTHQLTSSTRARVARLSVRALALCAALGAAGPVLAADHIDSPAAVAEPGADITDLYAWMTPEADKLNLVLNVTPFAGLTATFPTSVVYVFHINSSAEFGATQFEKQISCQFYDVNKIECWADGQYVEGDVTDPDGITGGAIRVFAGRRDDPFFFELTGFRAVVQTVASSAAGLPVDAQGCFELEPAVSSALVDQLGKDTEGAPASDDFAGASVLSLVLQVDKSVVTAPGRPIVSVWASTHAAL